MFSSLSEEPLGAASLAQVHLGKLLDGSLVAVKIQHPDVKMNAYSDMAIITVSTVILWIPYSLFVPHSLTHLLHPLTHSLTHSLHPLTHSLTHSLHPPTHSLTALHPLFAVSCRVCKSSLSKIPVQMACDRDAAKLTRRAELPPRSQEHRDSCSVIETSQIPKGDDCTM